MKTRVVKEFWLDGDMVIFRYPRFSDWPDLLSKVNSLTREKSFGSPQHIQTGKKCRQWMRQICNGMRKKESICLMVEIRGRVVGAASIWKGSGEPGVGYLGISIRSTMPGTREKLWGKGIGRRLIYAVMREAKTALKIRAVRLGAFVANHRAVALYRKCGFKKMYRVRREKAHYGKMLDRIYMKRRLP